MVQVLAVVMLAMVVVLLSYFPISLCTRTIMYIVLALLLLGISRPAMLWSDGTPHQGRWTWADGSPRQCLFRRPMPADDAHLQRHKDAEVVGKWSAVSGSPAALATPIPSGVNQCMPLEYLD